MGLKKMFMKKDPSEDELRNDLDKAGISTKGNSGHGRQEKFGAFKQYAQERNTRPGLAPVNPYANINNGGGAGGNPYAGNGGSGGPGDSNNPYGVSGSDGVGNPYGGSAPSSDGNPYSSARSSNPYGPSSSQAPANPYGSNGNGPSRSDPYSSRAPSAAPPPNPYGRSTTRSYQSSARQAPSQIDLNDDTASTLDLNRIPTTEVFQSKTPARRPAPAYDQETLDLNELPEEDDLNLEIDDDLPELQQVNSEDEEVEAIKQDIRFVKQESLASTRNTLRMAQEAEASGTNTLGMLGSQSERLYNAEQNLLLADTQTQIADSKVKELKRLNRSIFIPAQGNPFNKKSRLRQQEENLKTAKAQEKYMRDTNRREMYASEQRLKSGITNNATNNEVHQKYQGERDLAAARRYQFENDSEDDEVEKELASNLDQIALYANKLKKTAGTMGQEVDSQNNRLKKIEEDADRLDINVHMNNTRLANIR